MTDEFALDRARIIRHACMAQKEHQPTAPEHRKKGYGTQLVASMLQQAQQNGATHAYLQVMKENVPARRLYAKLGFQELYDYWYRVPRSYGS